MVVNIFKKFKNNIWLFLLIIISLIVYWRWISFSIFTYADWWFSYPENLKEFLIMSIWNSNTGLGTINLVIWRLPVYLFEGLLNIIFNFKFEVIDKIIVFWPFIILSGLGIFILIKKIIKSDLAAFIGSLVFCFNTYFLSINTQGHILISLGFCLSVFAILFFYYSLLNKKLSYLLITGIILFLAGSYDLRTSYICVFIIFIYYLFYICSNEKSDKLKATLYLILLGLITILLNSYWIISFYESNSLASSEVLNRSLFGNNFWSLREAITLFHPFWTGVEPSWFIVQPIPIYFWIIPFFAFLGLIFNRKNKNILFFGLITLIGIFLTKQVDLPFTNIYAWLYKYLPGFNAFREASKFYFLILLGYSVLIAGFIDFIIKNMNKSIIQKLCKLIIILLIVFIFIWNTKPLVTGEIKTLFLSRVVPEDYMLLKENILSQQEYYRTLWTPRDSRWGIFTNNHPKISNVDIIQTDWREISNYVETNPNLLVQEQIVNIYNKPYSDNVLDVSSIKYVIVPLRDTKNEDDFYVDYGNSIEYFTNILDKQSYLKKIDIGTEEVKIYENEGYLDHIYMSSINQTLDNLDKSKINNIEYTVVNPSEYKITFNSTEPFYLYFSEAYHPQWKLAQDFKWYKGFFDKNYIFDYTHFKSYGFLNGWYINPSELEKNSNGEYELTIYFQPQSYFYLGIFISGITLFLCIIYLIFSTIKGRKHKHLNQEINSEQLIHNHHHSISH